MSIDTRAEELELRELASPLLSEVLDNVNRMAQEASDIAADLRKGKSCSELAGDVLCTLYAYEYLAHVLGAIAGGIDDVGKNKIREDAGEKIVTTLWPSLRSGFRFRFTEGRKGYSVSWSPWGW